MIWVLFRYLILYGTTLAANNINVAWTTGGCNQTSSLFAAKLGWSADDTIFYNSMLNLASQVGKAIGAFIGGSLIREGRA